MNPFRVDPIGSYHRRKDPIGSFHMGQLSPTNTRTEPSRHPARLQRRPGDAGTTGKSRHGSAQGGVGGLPAIGVLPTTGTDLAPKNKMLLHIPASSLRIGMGKKFDTVQLGLRLAKAVAEDIPAPGLKSALGLASALAEMYDTMRGNKDDLPDPEDRLRALTEINDTSGCNSSLKGRLTVLQANLKPLLDKCGTLRQYHEKHKFRTFLFSFLIEKTIREMEKKISTQLEDFTHISDPFHRCRAALLSMIS
ncbi:hypothetical protein GGX14DRAFT_401105 [Mycena pura]|uniref:Uncharacterized protein n=1 Tax=Mycena pura TaxID=153505 RepID=A0AAD6V0U7_9AGAR|nr:hypothetical protein GGX14DRAFT_401105 [Mycena pura]